MSQHQKLKEIATVFFKLGCFAFGGPAAHIAMMEEEVVQKRKWMSQEHFLDLMGATNLIPGPNSTEMSMHCGHERAGWKGLFLAGICFIVPAVVITANLAWSYQKYGQLPEVTPFIYGIKPAVIALIVMAAYRLGMKALKSITLIILGILALIACLYGLNEIAVLLLTGAIGGIIYKLKGSNSLKCISPFPLLLMGGGVNTLKVFLSFLKIGAILYGSGYVLFAFLDAELVAKGWLSRQVVIDAVAVGQITPGPVLSTATFIGWQLQGFSGAIAATLGIFLPSFLFVLIMNPIIPKMRKSKLLGAVLNAVNVAAVALIVGVCIQMGIDTLTDWKTAVIGLLSLICVFGLKKLNPMFIVFGGSLLGYVLYLI